MKREHQLKLLPLLLTGLLCAPTAPAQDTKPAAKNIAPGRLSLFSVPFG